MGGMQTAKREKQAAMAELYRLTNIYEGECQNLRESIKTIESLMEERKATLPEHMQENPEQPKFSTPTTPVQTTPPQQPSSTSPVSSVPRFMSPTASSRGKKRTEQFTPAKSQSPATKAQSPTERQVSSPPSPHSFNTVLPSVFMLYLGFLLCATTSTITAALRS